MVDMVDSTPPTVNPLETALQALRQGRPILVYDGDGREEETDIILAGSELQWEHIRMLRKDAGGLICAAIGPDVHTHLGLPYLTDVLQAHQDEDLGHLLPDDIRYDASKPAFGLTINHRDTFTGITDQDRTLTIRALAELSTSLPTDATEAKATFGRQFRSPGHVHLLNGQPKGLRARKGHTELSLALMQLAHLPPVAVLCEMMDDRTGTALSRADAQKYAQQHDLPFLSGQEVIEAWETFAHTSA